MWDSRFFAGCSCKRWCRRWWRPRWWPWLQIWGSCFTILYCINDLVDCSVVCYSSHVPHLQRALEMWVAFPHFIFFRIETLLPSIVWFLWTDIQENHRFFHCLVWGIALIFAVVPWMLDDYGLVDVSACMLFTWPSVGLLTLIVLWMLLELARYMLDSSEKIHFHVVAPIHTGSGSLISCSHHAPFHVGFSRWV